MPRQQRKPKPLPSKDDVLAFIGSRDGKAGKREIARAFGIKGGDRIALKAMLSELADQGQIERRRKKLNRAGHLPSVIVADITGRDRDGELIAVPTEWDAEHGPAPKIRLLTPRRARPGETAGVNDRALIRITETEPEGDIAEGDIRHSGRIIKVIDRARARVLGIFRSLPGGGGRLSPIDKKQRELAIPPDAVGDAQDGDLVAVDLTRQGRLGLATGRVKERLGSLKTERAVSMIAIHAHGIPYVFNRETLAEAEAATPASLAGPGALAEREDWRALALVTIDPVDAKDHDDAVVAVADSDPANPGGHIVSVAIADVAHYVRPGSALDKEALERGNSVYFPDRVVPMLPERISNDLCSLREDEDRPALAVRMVVGADGRKRSHTFHRVLMRSRAKLNYAQVQEAIDGRPDAKAQALLPIIAPLYSAFRALHAAREAREPLDLDLPERKLVLKPDGTVDRVIMPPRLDAHRLIEEFMILANVAAAETLERARVPFIYRVHDEPSLEKLHALREFLASIDISLPKAGALRPGQFNRILARARGTEHENLVNEIVLRTQAQAEYAAENYGHFGLALRRYAHFTSPIRRYADLIVHRALIRALRLGPEGLPADQDGAALGEIAARISVAERRAMTAERETVDRLIAQFLSDRIGATFEGHISGVTRAGLFVKLDETGADGLVPARMIGAEYFRYHEDRHAMIGAHTGQAYRLGDPVTVRLVEAAPVAGALRFELLSEGRHAVRGSSRAKRAQERKAGRERRKKRA